MAGHHLELSSPDKVFFAERGDTKLDLAEYYLAVEAPLMAAMGGRPVLLQRFPDGAGGKSFFQKRVPKNHPDWLATATVSTPNGTTSEALVIADVAHVLYAVNMGCLGFHVWPSKAADLDHADELRIDLDPTPGVNFAMIREAAGEVRALLDGIGIVGHPKTSGNKGLHIYVRLQPRWDSYEVRAAAVALARELERRRPGPADRGLVEGGAGPAGVHRLQPERPAQDHLRRLVGAGPARAPRCPRPSPGTRWRPSTPMS